MVLVAITHYYDAANGTCMIHETTQRPRSENMSPDTCILETIGLRGSSIWGENKVFTYSQITIRRDIKGIRDLARGIDVINEMPLAAPSSRFLAFRLESN